MAIGGEDVPAGSTEYNEVDHPARHHANTWSISDKGANITPDDHQRLAYRTAPKQYKPLTFQQFELMHAVLGLASELGEIADTVKKHIIYGQPLDEDNLVEETGDSDWYAGLLLTAISELRSVSMEKNIAKLRKRYPDGYTDLAAAARADKVLELPAKATEPAETKEYKCVVCGSWNDVRGTFFFTPSGMNEVVQTCKQDRTLFDGHLKFSALLRHKPEERIRENKKPVPDPAPSFARVCVACGTVEQRKLYTANEFVCPHPACLFFGKHAVSSEDGIAAAPSDTVQDPKHKDFTLSGGNPQCPKCHDKDGLETNTWDTGLHAPASFYCRPCDVLYDANDSRLEYFVDKPNA